MKIIQKMTVALATGLLFFSLSGCASLTGEEEGFGAGLGVEDNSVLTGGGIFGTLGDEDAGGVIGDEAFEDDEVVEDNGVLEDDEVLEGGEIVDDDGLL